MILRASDRHYYIDVGGDTVAQRLTELEAVRMLARLMRTTAASYRLTLWGCPGVYLQWVSHRPGRWKRVPFPEGKVSAHQRLVDRVYRHWSPEAQRLMDKPRAVRGGSLPKPQKPQCTDCGCPANRWWRGAPVCIVHHRLRRESSAA